MKSLCFWLFSLFAVACSQFTPERSAWHPVRAELGRKEIDAGTPREWRRGGGQGVGLNAAQRNRATVQLQQRRQSLVAGVQGDNAIARTSGGKISGARKIADGEGYANAGRYRGTLDTSREADGRHAHLGTNRHTLDTLAEPGNDKFRAENERVQWDIDPHSQDRRRGQGVLHVGDRQRRTDEFYLYEINKDGQKTQAVLADNTQRDRPSENIFQQLFGARGAKKYTCTGERPGESTCVDERGRSAGKVVATNRGETIVYSKHGIPVARAKSEEISRGRYAAVINNGLITAKTDQQREESCMREHGGVEGRDKVRIERPITFDYHHQSERDGTKVFLWPDCFDMGANLVLDPGVNIEDLEVEFVVNILPIGQLKCVGIGTSGKRGDCIYGDLCPQGGHKRPSLDILDNTASNICEAKGGQRYKVTMTVCPPPETFKYASCTKFNKHLTSGYWDKKGDLHAEIRVWQKAANEEDVIKKFHDESGSLLGINKLRLKAEYIAANFKGASNINPSDADLLEWYVQERARRKILGCRRAIVKYGLGGSKVDNSFLLEAASTATNFRSLYETQRCPDFDRVQQEDFEAQKRALAGSGSGSSGGILGGLLGGRGGGGFGGFGGFGG